MEKTDARRRVPTVMAIGGSIIALGSLIGTGWRNALGVEVVTVVATAVYYILGGSDSDIGALLGSRTDERQTAIAMRSAALAGTVLCAVALGGFILTTAMGRFSWPFAIICVAGGGSYLTGLVIHRHH